MITIDGSTGEGGGQILRTSLALSLVTGTPVQIQRIRALRKKPGLQAQHLMAVKAAMRVGNAMCEGAEMGSTTLTFEPGDVTPGTYRFAVTTAGSATLVAQTVLPALLTAPGRSRIEIEGGTHNPLAPPFDFISQAFLPLINEMGPGVEAKLIRHGFYPAGGGIISMEVTPCERLARLDVTERGTVRSVTARCIVSRLPLDIAEREAKVLREALSIPASQVKTETVESNGPGNAVMVAVESERLTEVFSSIGQRGVRAERVASLAAQEARAYLDSGAPVGPHLADQLLLPMALAGGGSLVTVQPSSHTETNIAVIQKFVNVRIQTEPLTSLQWRISVQP